jgi:hypothetical protein
MKVYRCGFLEDRKSEVIALRSSSRRVRRTFLEHGCVSRSAASVSHDGMILSAAATEAANFRVARHPAAAGFSTF